MALDGLDMEQVTIAVHKDEEPLITAYATAHDTKSANEHLVPFGREVRNPKILKLAKNLVDEVNEQLQEDIFGMRGVRYGHD